MKKIIFGLACALALPHGFAFDGAGFFKKNCSSCHTIGEGDKIGPDLAGLSKRRDLDWIVKFVNYPYGMINGDPEDPEYKEADPVAKKVYELYKPMTMAEIMVDKAKMEAVLKYIDAQNKEPKGKILQLK